MQDLRRKIYFDTDAWRRIGDALSGGALSAEMRQRIVFSPITLLELLSQLALQKDKGQRVLGQVQSVYNCVDPTHREILPWPNVAIAHFGLRVTLKGDSFEAAGRNLNICMSAQDADEVQPGALKVMDALRQMKRQRSVYPNNWSRFGAKETRNQRASMKCGFRCWRGDLESIRRDS